MKHPWSPVAVVLATLLVLAPLAHAEEGLDAYRRGDYATAADLWRAAGNRGDAFAQFQMGYLYETGRGVTMSRDEAQRWYGMAQQQGYPAAARALERLSAMAPAPVSRPASAASAPAPSGPAIAPSPTYSAPVAAMGPAARGAPAPQAAGKGPICAEIQPALARHPRHLALALGWCAAADQADPAALYALGHVFASVGVFQQGPVFTLAEKYWTLAMNADHPHARTALGVLYARNGEATHRYPDAVRLLQAGADAGEPLAMYDLGALRYNGRAVPRDIRRALGSWMRAAELGSLQATLAMAYEYCTGENVPADLARGENLLATVRRMDPRIGRSTCAEWTREPTPWGPMSYDYPPPGFELPS